MENPNQSLQKQPDTQEQSIQTFEAECPISEQPDSREALIAFMVGKWVELRRSLLQMPDSLLPNDESLAEESREMKRLITVYSRLTPKQFSESIRKAARDKARFLSENPNAFPKLYCYDIEEELQAAGRELLKEKPSMMALEANTGGNAFFGEPSEALAREWPKIKAQTELLRKTININLRDRFWIGGPKAQRESAMGMLRQMVFEMKEAGKWDQRQCDWESLAIFQAEYKREFNGWDRLIEVGMDCPMLATQIADLKSRTEKKIAQAYAAGGSAPSIEMFPDPQDCVFCAVFDAYWKFWEGLQNAD